MPADAEESRLAKITTVISLHVRDELNRGGCGPAGEDALRLVRNAVYSTLAGLYYAGDVTEPRRNRNAQVWLSILLASVPGGWDEPELTDDLKATLALEGPAGGRVEEETRGRLADFCREQFGL